MGTISTGVSTQQTLTSTAAQTTTAQQTATTTAAASTTALTSTQRAQGTLQSLEQAISALTSALSFNIHPSVNSAFGQIINYFNALIGWIGRAFPGAGGNTGGGNTGGGGTVNPNFTPGSLSLANVPKDANGNITSAFLQNVLKPTNAVNTTIFDASDPSGLSKFARVGIRMLGHDLYDGAINGDVALRTLFAPDASHNTAFTQDAATVDMVKEWGRRDLADDGVINGSAYVKLIEQVWPATDGVAITGFANRLKLKAANTNAQEIFRTTNNVETPNGINSFVSQTGISANNLLNMSLWGHRILDKSFTGQSIANSALNDPTSIDFGFTHLNSSTLGFVQGLASNPNATGQMGVGVLNTLLAHLR
ncbi:MAG: hypothetical protein AB7P76_00995 [Candidatus Melainabacteria bacterium]